MRPVILGMNNPLSPDPGRALWPAPAGCTGWRLWKLLERRTGATAEQYCAAFERHNLLSALAWSDDEAQREAPRLWRELRGRRVLVLGEALRRAVGLPKQLIYPVVLDGVSTRQLPHPSGRCRWYNDPVCAELAALVLEQMYLEAS